MTRVLAIYLVAPRIPYPWTSRYLAGKYGVREGELVVGETESCGERPKAPGGGTRTPALCTSSPHCPSLQQGRRSPHGPLNRQTPAYVHTLALFLPPSLLHCKLYPPQGPSLGRSLASGLTRLSSAGQTQPLPPRSSQSKRGDRRTNHHRKGRWLRFHGNHPGFVQAGPAFCFAEALPRSRLPSALVGEIEVLRKEGLPEPSPMQLEKGLPDGGKSAGRPGVSSEGTASGARLAEGRRSASGTERSPCQ